MSAAGLGWEATLLESVTDGDLAVLLGVHVQTGVEAEHADCLLAVLPQRAGFTIDAAASVRHSGQVCDELRAHALDRSAEPAEQRSSSRGP